MSGDRVVVVRLDADRARRLCGARGWYGDTFDREVETAAEEWLAGELAAVCEAELRPCWCKSGYRDAECPKHFPKGEE